MRAEVIITCSFVVAVLSFLSNLRLCDVVGDIFRGVQLGTFGMVRYPVPVFISVGTCFHLSNQGNLHAAMKLVAVVAAAVMVCGLLQLFFGTVPTGAPWGDYYRQSYLTGVEDGWISGVLTSFLIIGLGKPGTFLTLVVLLIICTMYIIEHSFVNVVKKGGNKAHQYAKEDMDRRRKVHTQKAEERKRLREEQKVRGVNLDTTRLIVYDGYDEEKYDEEEFDRGFGAGLDEIPDGCQNNPVMGSVAAPGAPVMVNEFRGKFDPPPNHGREDTGGLGLDDVRASARSIEGYSERGSGVPVVTGISAEEDRFGYDGQGTIRIRKDNRTLKEINMADSLKRESSGCSEVSWDNREEGMPEEGGDFSGMDTYSRDTSEQDLNYDSVPAPKESKRVVTASGKVIEAETELLQKKTEKKHGGTVAKDETNLTVAKEVRKKEKVVKKEYIFPPIRLLKKGNKNLGAFSGDEYRVTAIKLQQILHNFGVGITVTNTSYRLAVVRYELLPEQGVKVSKIVDPTGDIRLSLVAADIRTEAPIPGKSAVGTEVPNKENNMVYLRDLLEANGLISHKSRLAFAAGRSIDDQVMVIDIAKIPRLLIVGTTGSSKFVCVNTLIMSIILKPSPDDVKLIMVDPKVVGLSVYNGIPHFLISVVTDPKKVSDALNWAVAEMTDRYKKFINCNVRDLKGYNGRVKEIRDIEDEDKLEKPPQIVIIIDEPVGLTMMAPGEVGDSICRLAQLTRATDIRLVIATQRPSVNVTTDLIKANAPPRIAFAVSSGVDSRTIIDMNGAEKPPGESDMLFHPAGSPKLQRVQGTFVSGEEVGRAVDFLTGQGVVAKYNPEVESRVSSPSVDTGGAQSDRDEYFVQVDKFIIEKEKASIGMLQRMSKIGFNRTVCTIDQLADAGAMSKEERTKPGKVLMTIKEFEEILK